MRHWTLDDIPWDRFDPAKVDPDLLRAIKAAAMVEGNGGDYGTYLCNVFSDDPEHLIALVGVRDSVVVHTPANAVLPP